MKFEIVTCRNIRGHDGQGFNATMTADGKKVAFIDDDGYGGGYQYTPIDSKGKPVMGRLEQQPWFAEFQKQATEYSKGDSIGALEIFAAKLIEDFDIVKGIFKDSKKYLVYAIDDQKSGEYFKGTPNTPQRQAQLSQKYGNKITFLLPLANEGNIEALRKVLKIKTHEEHMAEITAQFKTS